MTVTSELHDTHKQKEQRNRKEKRRRPPSEGAQAKTQNRKTVIRHGGALDDGSYVGQVGPTPCTTGCSRNLCSQG